MISRAGGAAWLALAALYLWCPVYRFPAARTFRGRRWYNPYASLAPGSSWYKANLHVHTRAWQGLTNGHGTAEDVARRYRAMGYDITPVSNYQEISRNAEGDASALTVYEHGYNLRKMHFLAVDARQVDWLDYPLLQGRDEEQHRIDRLRATGGLVIMAHPRLRNAVSDDDLRALTGYTAIEIGSNAGRGVDAWTVALDAGRPVWAVANDDTHDAAAPNEAGRYWTMIGATATEAGALRAAITAGRTYAVFGRNGHSDIALRTFELVGDTVTVRFDGPPADLQLIGPGGRVLAYATQAHAARWVVPCDAPWVRVAARTATTRLFLQPLLRSDDGRIPPLEASVAPAATLVRRMLAFVLAFIVIVSSLGREGGGDGYIAPRLELAA
jgi:hypothetical protein